VSALSLHIESTDSMISSVLSAPGPKLHTSALAHIRASNHTHSLTGLQYLWL